MHIISLRVQKLAGPQSYIILPSPTEICLLLKADLSFCQSEAAHAENNSEETETTVGSVSTESAS